MTLPVVTLDFETFYSKEYSLRKLTTEEYVRDPRFWVHMVGWKYNNAQTQVVLNPNQETLKIATNNGRCILVGHNLMFDAAILKWRYGIQCQFMYDTMCMAQPLFGQTVGASLGAVAKALLIGEKGTELNLMLGKYIRDLDAGDTAKVIEYNANDVELTRRVFDLLQPQTPKPEAYLIDMLLRMYIDPVLQLDRELLERHLNDVVTRREEILSQFDGDFITKLRSNQQFAELLRGFGVQPPMKISKTTGQLTYAFAKNDPEFLALKTHDDLRVSTLVHARLGVKSSIEETRTAAFISIAKRGPLPMPYKYWGAHTGRLSGQEKINPQNLGRNSPLRASIMAPPGHVLVVADSAQIEARMVAWLAGQQDLVQDFRDKVDIYSKFASTVYGKPINKKEHPVERFVGKTCILGLGYGMGADKFQYTLKVGQTPVEIDASEALRIVQLYRNTYPAIAKLWRTFDAALKEMVRGNDCRIGDVLELHCTPEGVHLPNGTMIRYPNLRLEYTGAVPGRATILYDARSTEIYLYGAKMVENVVQALARIVVMHQMMRFDREMRRLDCPDPWRPLERSDQQRRFKVALTTHDEIGAVVPEDRAEWARDTLQQIMSEPPSWARGLPVACEVGFGQRYSDAK